MEYNFIFCMYFRVQNDNSIKYLHNSKIRNMKKREREVSMEKMKNMLSFNVFCGDLSLF